MQIIMHSQHLEVSAASKEYIEKKLSRLSRYFDHIDVVEVHTSSQRGFKTVEVTANANGRVLRAEEKNPELQTAVDQVAAKLEKQLKQYKERLVDRNRRPSRRSAAAAIASEETIPEAAPEAPLIVRRKQFPVEIMSPEEAVDRLRLVGHDFFVFLSDESRRISVVYQRHDGGYGVLEPTPA